MTGRRLDWALAFGTWGPTAVVALTAAAVLGGLSALALGAHGLTAALTWLLVVAIGVAALRFVAEEASAAILTRPESARRGMVAVQEGRIVLAAPEPERRSESGPKLAFPGPPAQGGAAPAHPAEQSGAAAGAGPGGGRPPAIAVIDVAELARVDFVVAANGAAWILAPADGPPAAIPLGALGARRALWALTALPGFSPLTAAFTAAVAARRGRCGFWTVWRRGDGRSGYGFGRGGRGGAGPGDRGPGDDPGPGPSPGGGAPKATNGRADSKTGPSAGSPSDQTPLKLERRALASRGRGA